MNMTETLKVVYERFLSLFERFTSPARYTEKDANEKRAKKPKRKSSRHFDKYNIDEDIIEILPKKRAKTADNGENGINCNQDQSIITSDDSLYEMEKKTISSNKNSNHRIPVSSWVCKKPAEPSVKSRNPSFFPITRRRSLNSERDHEHSFSSQDDVDQQFNLEPFEKPSSVNAMQSSVSESEVKNVSKSTDSGHLDESTLSHQRQRVGRTKTVDTVVRLYERDAYKKVVDNYVFCQNLLSNGDVSVSSSPAKPVSRHARLDYTENEDFPRLKKADDILSKLSFALADTAKSSVLLSSTRITPETSVLQETVNLSKEERRTLPNSSRYTRDTHRTFSGMDTVNIARNDDQASKDPDTFGGSLTTKLRNILDTIEMERQARISKEERKLDDIAKMKRERDLRLLKRIDERKELDRRKVGERIPELTAEMESMVSKALGPGDAFTCLVEGFNISITRRDITTLADLNWLNDEVVNFYFNLLKERSSQPGRLKMHFFNSFFYPKLLKTGYSGVRRWTKKVDIFSVDIIVLPIHLGMHWCLAAIDIKMKKISYYDSLKGNNRQCLASLRNYLVEEHKDKKKTSIDINEWQLELEKDIPQQLNGCDCGVFTCKYADYITRGSKLTFGQENMPNFRRIMIYEILTKKLLQ